MKSKFNVNKFVNGLAKYRNMDYMPYKDIQGDQGNLYKLMKLTKKEQVYLANVNYDVHKYYTDNKDNSSLNKSMYLNSKANHLILHTIAGIAAILNDKQLIDKHFIDKSYVKGYIGNE